MQFGTLHTNKQPFSVTLNDLCSYRDLNCTLQVERRVPEPITSFVYYAVPPNEPWNGIHTFLYSGAALEHGLLAKGHVNNLWAYFHEGNIVLQW